MITIFISCNKENLKKTEQNDAEKYGLKGNVKTFEVKMFNATEKFGETVKLELRDWSILTFNNSGNIIEKKALYENGKISAMTKFKYNKENIIIEETFVCGGRSDLIKYSYGKNGRDVEFTHYTNGEIAIKQTNKFDRKNNLIERKVYEYDGILRNKILSKMNEQNLEFEEEEYFFNGTSCIFTGKKTNEYDENGNLIEEKKYDKKGNIEFVCKYVYDDKNNEIENIFSKDNIITKKTQTLDEFGNCIESIEYSNDIPKKKFKNNLIYDKKGNWIKNINIKDEIVNGIVERRIEYFN